MENHEFKIKNIVLISTYTDIEALKDLLEYNEDSFNELPFPELTGEDFNNFDDWLQEITDKGIGGFLFKASSPVCYKRKESKSMYYSWGYCQERLMHANSFEEAEFKAKEYANMIKKDVETNNSNR